jgi:hypothetical protein
MITMDQAKTLQGKTLFGEGRDKLGTIDTLYADREDGDPTFATVHTGLFGTKTSFVPLADARMEGDDVLVPYTKKLVGDAPKMDADTDLEPDEEQRLYSHYGMGGGMGGDTTTTTDETSAGMRGAGQDMSGPNTDDAMTRSEEQVRVGTQDVETGRARLRKYVVTENVTQTVPVSHEEVRIDMDGDNVYPEGQPSGAQTRSDV